MAAGTASVTSQPPRVLIHRPRVWIWLKRVDQSHRPEEGRGGGRLQGTWSALHVAACLGLPGRGGTLGTSTGSLAWRCHHLTLLSPCGTWLIFPCPSACLAGAAARPASGQSWLAKRPAPHARFQLFTCCASPRETGGRPWKASAGDPGEDRRGVSLP